MTKMYDIGSGKLLLVGNSYSYAPTAADKEAYTGFFITGAAAVEITDGVDTITLTLAASEEVRLNNTTTAISLVVAADNELVFLY